MIESIEDFAKMLVTAEKRAMVVEIGEDEQSGLVLFKVSSQPGPDGVVLRRTYYVDGHNLHRADTQCTFAEAVMASGMDADRKIYWLYESVREYETDLAEGRLKRVTPELPAPEQPAETA